MMRKGSLPSRLTALLLFLAACAVVFVAFVEPLLHQARFYDETLATLRDQRARFAAEGFGNVALHSTFIERNPDLAFLYAQISSLNAQLTPQVRAQIATRDDPVTGEALAGLSVPTLLITSENDAVFPPAAIREVAAMMPVAELVELPEAGHSPYFETPEAFNSTVGAFLERHAT